MSFPRYPEYKDSGVEWLGEVPAHWGVAPLKRGYSVCLGKMLKPDATSPDDEYLPYLRAANIKWAGVDVSDVKSMWFSPWERQQLLLQHGDLLVSEGGDVGRSALWEGELSACYFQNSVNRIRPLGKNSTSYAYYWMSLLKDKGFIDVLCNKSTIAHFTAEKVQAVPMAFPPCNEQGAICTFLDGEVSKIDGLISEQEKLIALLKEKRQAVISHAVTKGLDPNVPMKDSGIEWLGEVPAHWDIGKLRYFATIENGTTPSRTVERYWDGGDVPWLSSGEVNQIRVDCAEEFITEAALKECSLRLLPVGTIVVGMIGQGRTRGMSAILNIPATINQNLAAVCPCGRVVSEYLLYVLHAAYESLREEGRGGNQAALNCEILSGLNIPIPPVSEQAMIVSAIRNNLEKFDLASDEAGRGIGLLVERRSALISAAVTGKIDVR